MSRPHETQPSTHKTSTQRANNYILPKLINMSYMTIINANLGHHHLKFDDKLLNLTTDSSSTYSPHYHMEWLAGNILVRDQ